MWYTFCIVIYSVYYECGAVVAKQQEGFVGWTLCARPVLAWVSSGSNKSKSTVQKHAL